MLIKKRFPFSHNDFLSYWFAGCICAIGILFRLVFYFQNNDLIIDEANIARNLAERDFGGLLLPLRYEQYAPPLFLWIEKVFSLMLGFSERALRLFPMLSGIAALFVFYKILRRLDLTKSFWYPLALLAFGAVFIKHSVEIKQYMSDVLITLLLILLALSIDIDKTGKKRFLIIWILAGSLAVWSSMPSVFVLLGIGAYYTWQVLANKKGNMLGRIVIPSVLWLSQFIIYYELILKKQISSSYLQNYHQQYFLFLFPSSTEEWIHNGKRLLGFMGDVGGFTFIALLFNGMLIGIGMIYLLKKNKPAFLLTVLPLASLFMAAALHQYALVERLILFSLPLALMIIGLGFEPLMQQRSRVLKTSLIVVALICIYNYSMLKVFYKRGPSHEMTAGLDYLAQKQVSSQQLYIHHYIGDAYIYYMQLHPSKNTWRELSGATILKWDSDYSVVTRDLQDTVYFLYPGGIPPDEEQMRISQIEVNMKQVDYFEKYDSHVVGFFPKLTAWKIR